MKTILRVLVGSRAHGLNTDASDYDWREVFVQPTETVLGLTGYKKLTNDNDDTRWEVGHFCHLALKCNPSILEALCAPASLVTPEGQELRDLFPKFLSKRLVRDAFKGFATSQKKSMLTRDVPVERTYKFMAHWLRMLYCGSQLLAYGVLPINIGDGNHVVEARIRAARKAEMTIEEGINLGTFLESSIDAAYEVTNIPDEPDVKAIEAFLLKVRLNNLTPDSVAMIKPAAPVEGTEFCS